jgi:hypothetical protein
VEALILLGTLVSGDSIFADSLVPLAGETVQAIYATQYAFNGGLSGSHKTLSGPDLRSIR